MTKKTTKKSTAEEFEHALRERERRKYVFRLFVTGLTPRSLEAIENVRSLCEQHLKGRYQLDVIDVYKEPEAARKHQIIAAPTLIKELPLPIRKFVGNMTRSDTIVAGLDIRAANGAS